MPALLVALLLAAAAGALPLLFVPEYRDAYERYGYAVPLVTSLVLRWYRFLPVLLPAMVLVCWLLSSNVERKGLRAVKIAFAFFMIVPMLVGLAMFLPFFKP